jgi:CheY-like chemotaxis protein
VDSLSGKSILVVEDDYLEASELKHRLTEAGINVVGPAPNVEQALELITTTEALAGAVLDINLSGEMVFPVADELERLGVPFIFATGYERDVFPPRLADGILLRKPVGEHAVISALLRARDVDEVSVADATASSS